MSKILTTHVGSLPRPEGVFELLQLRDDGAEIEASKFNENLTRAVNDVVGRQVQLGLDVVTDGEMSKISYSTYVKYHLTGFEGEDIRYERPADLQQFSGFAESRADEGAKIGFKTPSCINPIGRVDNSPMRDELQRFRNALALAGGRDAVMTAASPGVIALFLKNRYYSTHESYLSALVDAMKLEFEAIVKAGFLLQVDCPDLAIAAHLEFINDKKAFLHQAQENIEALNACLVNIPADKLRMHVCWGNYVGPHNHDIALHEIIQLLYQAKPKALLIEGMNPRHAHEWVEFKRSPLPEDKCLIPGFIDTTNNMIEHPELIAQHICRYASVVDKYQLMAGTDCGFGTFAGRYLVHPDIVWAKLEALVEGAKIASQRLF